MELYCRNEYDGIGHPGGHAKIQDLQQVFAFHELGIAFDSGVELELTSYKPKILCLKQRKVQSELGSTFSTWPPLNAHVTFHVTFARARFILELSFTSNDGDRVT